MLEVWNYTLLSVFIVSFVSLVGVLTLSINAERLKTILIYLISFSAGALFGDVFLHLLPELVEESGFEFTASIYLLSGIVTFFILEKVIHWHHYHMPITKKDEKEHPHAHAFTYTILIGDGLHNFIDGLIIGSSYILSVPAGIATTIAVVLHEIPQEIGDFGVLLHGGFTRKRALFVNFLSALTAILGAIVALLLGSYMEGLQQILIPIAAGGFIYIAGSDLIPELHKERKIRSAILQVICFIIGIAVMASLLLLE